MSAYFKNTCACANPSMQYSFKSRIKGPTTMSYMLIEINLNIAEHSWANFVLRARWRKTEERRKKKPFFLFMIFFLYICVCSRSSWQARRRSGLGHATRASQKHLAITSLSPPSLSSLGTYQKNPVLFFVFLFRASFSFLIRTHSNCALGLELYNWTVHIGAANYAYPFAPHMFMDIFW